MLRRYVIIMKFAQCGILWIHWIEESKLKGNIFFDGFIHSILGSLIDVLTTKSTTSLIILNIFIAFAYRSFSYYKCISIMSCYHSSFFSFTPHNATRYSLQNCGDNQSRKKLAMDGRKNLIYFMQIYNYKKFFCLQVYYWN